jgi:hypothetical protein
MRHLLYATIITLLAFSLSHAHMESSNTASPGYGGHMTGSGMMGSTTQEDDTSAVAPGYGGHMTGSGMTGGMMGSGMMGYGSGYGMMSPCMMGGGMMQGMMGSGYTGHMMGSEMMGFGMMGYGSEEELRRFLDETVEIRREINSRQFEFSEALRNPDTTLETLMKLKKEILELQLKAYEKALKNK